MSERAAIEGEGYALICAPLAFDYVIDLPGSLKEHARFDRDPFLAVDFPTQPVPRRRGGCGGNIAYNLALLGEHVAVAAAVGDDFGEYRAELERRGIDTRGAVAFRGEPTATAFILADAHDNRITAFASSTLTDVS